MVQIELNQAEIALILVLTESCDKLIPEYTEMYKKISHSLRVQARLL